MSLFILITYFLKITLALQSTIISGAKYEYSVGVVSIATCYGMDGPGIESRWGARVSAPMQSASEAYSASQRLFSGGKAAGTWR